MSRPGQAGLARAVTLAARDAGLGADLLGDFADVLAAGRRPDEQELAGYRSLGEAAAEGGASLPALVDLYLSAAWRAWPHLPAVAAAVRAGDVRAVRDIAAGVLRAADDTVAALTEGWQEARRRVARREEARRREFVDDLLSGGAEVAGVLDRAEAMGLHLAGAHRVLVARAGRAVDDTEPVAREIEAGLAATSRGALPLVASKEGLLACVVARAAGSGRGVAEYVASRLAALDRAGEVRVAVSRPRPGVAGVRRGWREGREALELADRLRLSGPVVHADDLLAHALLLRDPGGAADLVETVLGPLAGARGGALPLVDTLLALFDAGGNTTAAARALHLSVRAVHYRLDRVGELTGYSLDDPTHRFTLQSAALGARLLGWPTRPLTEG